MCSSQRKKAVKLATSTEQSLVEYLRSKIIYNKLTAYKTPSSCKSLSLPGKLQKELRNIIKKFPKPWHWLNSRKQKLNFFYQVKTNISVVTMEILIKLYRFIE